MRTHNTPFFSIKKKSNYFFQILQPWIFSKGLKNEFETARVNEPSGFEPLKFYCITTTFQLCKRSSSGLVTKLLKVTSLVLGGNGIARLPGVFTL